ncbi:hypothetical protein RRG08_050665, partial [Elysia crispata]
CYRSFKKSDAAAKNDSVTGKTHLPTAAASVNAASSFIQKRAEEVFVKLA